METILKDTRVAFIGMGQMATEMELQLQAHTGCVVTEVRRGDDLTVLEGQDVTIASMRPQQWSEVNEQTGRRVYEEIAEHVNRKGIFLWIMAGKKMREMREDLGEDIALVRAMPTLVVDGYSETALFAEEGTLTEQQKAKIEAFFAQFGNYTWLESEDKFPIHTIYAASMLAFLAEYLQSFKADATKHGYGEDQSEQLLAGALRAAAHLVDRGYTLEQITRAVMTKGGMTEAGVEAARRRARLRRVTGAMLGASLRCSAKLAKR